MKVYIIWLLGVIAWNFLVPNAAPIEDVIVAVLLSFLSICQVSQSSEPLKLLTSSPSPFRADLILASRAIRQGS